MEAVKAIGEGSRRPQTAYRHHWVLTGLANKLFLEALWVGVDRGAEALDNWGLGRIKRRLWTHRTGSRHTHQHRNRMEWNELERT